MAQLEQDPEVSQNSNVEPEESPTSVEDTFGSKADLDAYVSERVEEVARQWQSQIDQKATKLEMGLQKRLGEADGLIMNLQSQGVEIDDAAHKAVRTEIIQEAYATPPVDGPTNQQRPMTEEDVRMISGVGQRLIQSFEMDNSDPEMNDLVLGGSVQEYFESITAAGRKRMDRMNGEGDRVPAQAAVPSGGKRPAGKGAPPNPYAVNLDDLYERANKSLRKKAAM